MIVSVQSVPCFRLSSEKKWPILLPNRHQHDTLIAHKHIQDMTGHLSNLFAKYRTGLVLLFKSVALPRDLEGRRRLQAVVGFALFAV